MGIGIRPSRAAAGLLLVFATSHTFGGLLFPPSNGAIADAVLTSMKSTHFDFHGADCTFYGFHMGFGLITSTYLLLAAAMAWILGDEGVVNDRTLREAQRPFAWALLLSLVTMAGLSWKYFFLVPGVVSTAATLLVAWECVTTFSFR